MATEAPPLSPEDYQQLLSMSLSPDPETRTQAHSLASKLTPSEQQEFFNFQQQANKGKGEATRTDNNVLGLPPEAAALGVAAIGRAVAAPAASVAQRITSGVSSAVENFAAPQVKYQITKRALQAVGVPSPIAEIAAVAVSSYRKGASANEPLTPGSAAEESALLKAGVDPKAVARYQAALSTTQTLAAPVTTTTEPPVGSLSSALPKPMLTAPETAEYLKMIASGKSSSEAGAAILAMRQFASRFGMPAVGSLASGKP